MGFDFGEDGGSEVYGGRVFAERARHDDENAMDLGLLFVEEANKFVVLLDGFERLDEYGLTRRGRTVNDARNFAFELCFDRDDEAVAANRDEIVLSASAFAQAAADMLLEMLNVNFVNRR